MKGRKVRCVRLLTKVWMDDHYKLYEGYCKKTNECRSILEGIDYSEAEGNQVYSHLRSVSVDYTFALLGFKNHELYFGHLGGDGGEPNGRFAELLEEEFNPGGLEGWKQAVRKAASAARDWVMVGYDLNDGSLFNYILDSQNLWAVYNMVPVLALDVYEHAYAPDFGGTPAGRSEYVEAFFRNLDWDHVNRQLIQAEAARELGCAMAHRFDSSASASRRVRRPPRRSCSSASGRCTKSSRRTRSAVGRARSRRPRPRARVPASARRHRSRARRRAPAPRCRTRCRRAGRRRRECRRRSR